MTGDWLDKIIDKYQCQYGHDDNPFGPCEGKVELRHAMTAYHFEGERNSPEDPNKDFLCCEMHYEEYCKHWKEQWDEYYSMVR